MCRGAIPRWSGWRRAFGNWGRSDFASAIGAGTLGQWSVAAFCWRPAFTVLTSMFLRLGGLLGAGRMGQVAAPRSPSKVRALQLKHLADQHQQTTIRLAQRSTKLRTVRGCASSASSTRAGVRGRIGPTTVETYAQKKSDLHDVIIDELKAHLRIKISPQTRLRSRDRAKKAPGRRHQNDHLSSAPTAIAQIIPQAMSPCSLLRAV